METDKLIFIIDDEPKNLQYLGTLLRSKKYQVSFSMDGEGALSALEKVKPDLILLDVNMPGMNGYEVCVKIKSNEQLASIPIIFLTSETRTENIVKGFKLGAADYVGKPFNEIELIARVETHLQIQEQTKQIKDYNKYLEEINEKMDTELNQAVEYLLTQLPPKFNKDLGIGYKYVPASHLGGDIFGYNKLDEDNLALYLIDVSGHGVSSTLMAVSVLNMIKSQSLKDVDYYDPASLLNSFNSKFKMEEQSDKFFTIWYGVINSKEKTITCSSAMHPPALLFNSSNSMVNEVGNKQIMIGAIDDYIFENVIYKYSTPCNLFLFSDGCFELELNGLDSITLGYFTNLLSDGLQNDSDPLEYIFHTLLSLNKNNIFDDDYTMIQVKLV